MHTIPLLASSGSARVDQIIRDIIGLLEPSFPGRVRGYYLLGSYAVGEALPTSDIDLLILFKGSLEPAERQHFEQDRAKCKQRSAVMLDLTPESEAKLFRVGGVWFQSASVLMYGEDVRPRVPRKPVESHVRDLMHSVYPLLARVRGNPERLIFPLDYPDPASMLYGYDRRHRLSKGLHRIATKDLVTNVLAVANALTWLAARQYVGSGKKSHIVQQYRAWIGDEWSELVEQVFEDCRKRWGYLLPEPGADRARLRDLCQRGLAFENHFLARYKPFLVAELQHPEHAIQLFAARRLGQLIYRDTAVLAALAKAGASEDAELRQAAADTLRQYAVHSS